MKLVAAHQSLLRHLENIAPGKKANIAPGPRLVDAALRTVDPESVLTHSARASEAKKLLGSIQLSDVPAHMADSLNDASLEQARQTLEMVARIAPEVDRALAAAKGRNGQFDLALVSQTFAAEVGPLVHDAGEIGNWLTHHLWVAENAGSTEHGERSNAPKRRPWVLDRTSVELLKSKSPADGAALEATIKKNNAGQIARNLKFAALAFDKDARSTLRPGLEETGASYLASVQALDSKDPFAGMNANSADRLSEPTTNYLFGLLGELVALKQLPSATAGADVAKAAPLAFAWLGDIVHTAFVAQRIGSPEGISPDQAVPFSKLGSTEGKGVNAEAQWQEIRYDVDAAIGTVYGLLRAGGKIAE